MGASYKHLKAIDPADGYCINGACKPLPEATSAESRPSFPKGEARHKGNRAEGSRANVAPSMAPDGTGPTLSK